MARLRVEGLTKSFPSRAGRVAAVDGLSLAVEEGELLVMLGPSGCGKTTTLRLIAGLERPDSGVIELDGERIDSRPPQARPISLGFQSPALFPQLTVERNVELGLRLRKVPRGEREKRVGEMLELLEIAELAGRLPEQLSGGQQQRVALARALAISPRLFLLDEPLASVDPGARLQLRGVIKRVQRQTGTAMIYVTHDQGEALALGDRVGVMQRGRMEQVGTPVQVYYTPENLFVAQFIGSPPMNLFEARMRPPGRIEIAAIGTTLEAFAAVSEGRRLVAGIRAEDVHIRIGGESKGRIAEVTPAYPEEYVRMVCGGCEVIARANRAVKCGEGETVGFEINPAAVHLFDAESGKRINPG